MKRSFQDYVESREAELVANVVMDIVSDYPTVDEAWSDVMLPVILEGSYSSLDELMENWLTRKFGQLGRGLRSSMFGGPEGFNTKEIDPGYTSSTLPGHFAGVNQTSPRPRNDPLQGDYNPNNPVADLNQPRAGQDRMTPWADYNASGKQRRARELQRRQGFVDQEAESHSKGSAQKAVQWFKDQEQSHREALQRVRELGQNTISSIRNALNKQDSSRPFDQPAGKEVLQKFLRYVTEYLSKLIYFNSDFDKQKYLSQAQDQHTLYKAPTLKDDQPYRDEDGSDYQANLDARYRANQQAAAQDADYQAGQQDRLRGLPSGRTMKSGGPRVSRGYGDRPVTMPNSPGVGRWIPQRA